MTQKSCYHAIKCCRFSIAGSGATRSVEHASFLGFGETETDGGRNLVRAPEKTSDPLFAAFFWNTPSTSTLTAQCSSCETQQCAIRIGS
jgi:hypothetical protein